MNTRPKTQTLMVAWRCLLCWALVREACERLSRQISIPPATLGSPLMSESEF